MNETGAKKIASDALLWLIQDDELISSFLGWSGVDAGVIRDRVSDPQFLGFVLDFVLMQDEWVIAAAAAAKIKPEDIVHARSHLPGGDNPHWT